MRPFCPDSSIPVKDGKRADFDFDHCKGCGICWKVCPFGAIDFVKRRSDEHPRAAFGNEAVAYAMRQINPDVFAAFPITPSTEIPQYFAQYVANGQVDTEYVTVESEHSSMSTCIGAEAAGVRAVTATSSCGLAFMYELLYVAASSRLPITLACVNRALTGPDQHQQRPFGFHGRARRGLDPAVCGEQPGGV